MPLILLISFIFFIPNLVSANTSAEIELSNGSVVEVSFVEKRNGYRYEVLFENGHQSFYEQSGAQGFGGVSQELTDKEMNLAREAIDKYEVEYGSPASDENSTILDIIIGVLFILTGLLGAIFPHTAWYLEIGWKLKDAEPSDLAIFANRAGGIVVSIIGIFILF